MSRVRRHCRALRHAGLICALLATGACSTVPDEPALLQTREQIEKRQALQQWRLNARLGVQSATEGGSLDMFWTQRGERYQIRLVAPLGQGALLLEGDASQVSARLASGERLQGEPGQLLQQHFGVAVPVASLRYWLRGLPAPDTPLQNVERNAAQQLQRFTQHGWKVELRDYRKIADVMLPHRFYLEPLDAASAADGGDTSVRLLVQQWVLN